MRPLWKVYEALKVTQKTLWRPFTGYSE